MPNPSSSRAIIREIGANVHAKALQVTNEAECRRRYGAKWKTKLLPGVVELAAPRPGPTGRQQWFIIAKYNLGGNPPSYKTVELHQRSVQPGDPPSHENPTPTADDPPPAATEATTPAALTAPGTSTDAHDAEIASDEQQQPPPAEESTETPGDPPSHENPTPTEATSETPAQVAHGVHWYKDNNRALHNINGHKGYKEWGITTAVGEKVFASNREKADEFSRLDLFLMMFPPDHLRTIAELTNRQLQKLGNEVAPTTRQEILKFFGICILATKFEFGNRRDLWTTTAPTKYRPAPCFGNTGMSRSRFDLLYTHIRFSNQPEERPLGLTHERWRWMLVDDFVDAFNRYREQSFLPSDLLCVDESFSRWYGLGGYWINKGLPQYVAMERKPEAGCEIQDACCGRSGVMLRLKLVKTASEEEHGDRTDNDGLLHGTKVLRSLVQPWAFSDRTVVADSYFSSVGAADEMSRLGIGFIGVVKTATRQYPLQYLSHLELSDRGDFRGVITLHPNGAPSRLAFVWMDRDRRYFISNTSSLAEGAPYIRERWRQVAEVETNEEPQMTELTIPMPKAAEVYYSACGMIDRHNRSRQDNLQLERKLGTKEWHRRVNFSILGIIIVDTWLVYKGFFHDAAEPEKDFYDRLAEELIDNAYDSPVTRRRGRSMYSTPSPLASAFHQDGSARSGLGIHITPTKRKRKGKNYLLQGNCKVCKKKTTNICSSCKELAPDKETWICNTRRRDCFAVHLAECHSSRDL